MNLEYFEKKFEEEYEIKQKEKEKTPITILDLGIENELDLK